MLNYGIHRAAVRFISSGSSVYFGLAGYAGAASTTEANHQILYHSPATFFNFEVQVLTNTASGAGTFVSRKNTANGNASISIPAATTGRLYDLVSVDTVVLDDLANIKITGGTGGDTSVWAMGCLRQSTLQRLVKGSSGTSSAAMWGGLLGAGSSTSYAADVKCYLPMGATFSSMAIHMNTNTANGTSTYDFQVNETAAGPTVSVPATTTGTYEDLSNSATAVAGDYVGYKYTRGGSSGTPTSWYMIDMEAEATVQFQASGFNAPSGAYVYGLFGASNESSTETEANSQFKMQSSWEIFDVHIWASNGHTGALTIVNRVDSADGVFSFSVPEGSSGWYSDTSSVQSLSKDSGMFWKYTTGTGAGTTIVKMISARMAGTDQRHKQGIKLQAVNRAASW